MESIHQTTIRSIIDSIDFRRHLQSAFQTRLPTNKACDLRNIVERKDQVVRSIDIISWRGYCYVHQHIDREKISFLKTKYPRAEVMVHPECTPEVRRIADLIGSTAQMQRQAHKSKAQEYIVGTEDGLTYRLEKDNPEKRFYPVGAACVGMKRNTLHDVLFSLREEKHEVHVPEETRIKAYKALSRMMKSQGT